MFRDRCAIHFFLLALAMKKDLLFVAVLVAVEQQVFDFLPGLPAQHAQ
jgi:hypothetical protein